MMTKPLLAAVVLALAIASLATPADAAGNTWRAYFQGASDSANYCGTVNLQLGCAFSLPNERASVSVTLYDETVAQPMFQAKFVSGGFTKVVNCVQSCSVGNLVWDYVTVSLYPAGDPIKTADACHWCGLPPTYGMIEVVWW